MDQKVPKSACLAWPGYDQMLQAIERKRLNIRLETLSRTRGASGKVSTIPPCGGSPKWGASLNTIQLMESSGDKG